MACTAADDRGRASTPRHATHTSRSDAASELAALQGARADLELGQAILVDELKQCKAENEQLVAHAAKLGARITTSTADYGDILQHREEQVRTAEGRASLLQQQLDRLQADLAQAAQEAAALKVCVCAAHEELNCHGCTAPCSALQALLSAAHVTSTAKQLTCMQLTRAWHPCMQEASTVQGRKLEDAAALVADMERLEELLKKQHALIEQRGTEIKVGDCWQLARVASCYPSLSRYSC
jgi:chromosome segregation ATPase